MEYFKVINNNSFNPLLLIPISTLSFLHLYISTVFRPKPLADISGKKVLFATTAPKSIEHELVDYLETNYNCEIVGTTNERSIAVNAGQIGGGRR